MSDPRSAVQNSSPLAGFGGMVSPTVDASALDVISPDVRDAMAGGGTGGAAPSSDNRFVTDDELHTVTLLLDRPSNADLVAMGLRSRFSFAGLKARRLGRLGIGHTGIKPGNIF